MVGAGQAAGAAAEQADGTVVRWVDRAAVEKMGEMAVKWADWGVVQELGSQRRNGQGASIPVA